MHLIDNRQVARVLARLPLHLGDLGRQALVTFRVRGQLLDKTGAVIRRATLRRVSERQSAPICFLSDTSCVVPQRYDSVTCSI